MPVNPQNYRTFTFDLTPNDYMQFHAQEHIPKTIKIKAQYMKEAIHQMMVFIVRTIGIENIHKYRPGGRIEFTITDSYSIRHGTYSLFIKKHEKGTSLYVMDTHLMTCIKGTGFVIRYGDKFREPDRKPQPRSYIKKPHFII